VGLYVDSTKTDKEGDTSHRELFRFVQWCGSERVLNEINPSEIGEYADSVGGSGTTPLAAERLQVIRGFLSYARKKGMIDKNLSQHVRIRKSRTRSASSNRTQSSQATVQLTAEGHAQLVQQLEKLKSERAPLAQQIQKAAADKDVRENAPLEAAREQLGHVESRIRDLETQLKDAVILDPSQLAASRIVKLGVKVSVKDVNTGRETSYVIVNRSESNPLESKISDVSPMGLALIGKAVGQEIAVESPRGTVRYMVTKIAAR
jgi:transcription elongation factor GreA